jgi:hypothetical protein
MMIGEHHERVAQVTANRSRRSFIQMLDVGSEVELLDGGQ